MMCLSSARGLCVRQVLAPRLRKKDKNQEGIDDFFDGGVDGGVDNDPELMINPVMRHHALDTFGLPP